MEQNNNKRLDDLFNQAKTEPAKFSFEETKVNFLNSTSALGKVAKGGRLTQFTNFKLILMITTICAITLGVMTYFGGSSDEKIKEETLTENREEVTLMDSAIITEEHERVVQEYFKKVEALSPIFGIQDTTRRKLKKRKHKALDKPWFQKEQGTIEAVAIETVENYRFPSLNAEEWKAHQKQMTKMFGKVKKQKKSRGKQHVGVQGREQWYQPDPQGYLFIPMGLYARNGDTISIQAFYMKQTEVTNLEYRTFLFELLKQGRKEEFLNAKPDQNRWVKDYPYAFVEPMKENYFSHPAYDAYPVVGLSRESVEMYCKWMTEELNKIGGNNVNNFRLPSKYEWEWAAKGGLKKSPYPWGGPYLRNSDGCFLANFKPGSKANEVVCESFKDNKNVLAGGKFTADGAFFTAKVNSYNPNEFGLYCMSGNVAEMVIDENNKPATKGGSWSSVGQELQIVEGKDRFKGLIKPSVDVGFRPVLTYLGRAKEVSTNEFKPFGTKRISNELYMDETEVTNFMWQEYLNWQEKTYGKFSNEYIESLPDTTVWTTREGGLNEPYVKHYFSHPVYRLYPVVGISYQQAQAFCKWRTDRVLEFYALKEKADGKPIYPLNFEYRLPTKEEWERVASSGFSEKTLKKLNGKNKGQSRYNLKRKNGDNMGVAGKLNDNADVAAPSSAYWPNKFGIYNTIGNVAEMTLEKGIAKGGSWVHTEEEATVEKNFKYSEPHSWLGFRCVFVKISK
jgi:formylglycine-generating enzyme required for sulfatase activity